MSSSENKLWPVCVSGVNAPVGRGDGGRGMAVWGVGISASLKWTMTSNVNSGLMGKKKDNEDTNKVRVMKQSCLYRRVLPC